MAMPFDGLDLHLRAFRGRTPSPSRDSGTPLPAFPNHQLSWSEEQIPAAPEQHDRKAVLAEFPVDYHPRCRCYRIRFDSRVEFFRCAGIRYKRVPEALEKAAAH